VWDVKTASRLVVTVLENRIVPPIFLEEPEEQLLPWMASSASLPCCVHDRQL